jgi:hypothetical protein
MNVEQLKSILGEYAPSMRLVVVIEQQRLLKTTVVEMLLKLMTQPPAALLTFYGRSNVIIRERVEEISLEGRQKKWLEIDLR